MKKSDLGEWLKSEDYLVCVHEMKQERIHDSGLLKPKYVHSLRLLVSYENRGEGALKFRLGNWLLFDKDGYSYDPEIRNQFYGKDKDRKLREGVINAGKKARGWVAFQIRTDTEIDYIQFRSGYLTKDVLDIQLT